MEFVRGLLILAALLPVASADANDTESTLPPNKEYIKPCQEEALLLHPGVIEEQRILHRMEIFGYDSMYRRMTVRSGWYCATWRPEKSSVSRS